MSKPEDETIVARALLTHVHRLGVLASPEEVARQRKVLDEAWQALARNLPEAEQSGLARWWALPDAS